MSEGGKTFVHPIVLDPGVEKNVRVKPPLSTAEVFRISPNSSDFTNKVIQFQYQSGDFVTRLINNAFNFVVGIKITNPLKDKTVASLRLKADGKLPTALERGLNDTVFNLDTVTLATNHVEGRAMYWNPVSTAIPALISEVEILCNGIVVQRDTTGFMSVYSTLNRIFSREEFRIAAVGHRHILHNSLDREAKTSENFTRKDTISPAYKYALDQLDAQTLLGDADGKEVLYCLSGGLDGLIFAGLSKNLSLQSMMNDLPSNPEMALIPPNTHLVIRIRLCDDPALRLIDGTPNDYAYLGDVSTLTADEQRPAKIDIELKDVFLLAQRFIPATSEKLQKRIHTASKYYIDQPLYRTVNVIAGHLISQFKCQFPPGIRMVYIAFMGVHQLYRSPDGKVLSDGTRFNLPKEFKKIVFKLNGQPFLFDGGLEIPAENRDAAADAMRLYSYYRDRRLTSDSFSSFWPRGATAVGYKQAFALDLTPYQLQHGEVEIGVEIQWKTAAPKNTMCLFCAPHEVCISRSGGTFALWESDAIGS